MSVWQMTHSGFVLYMGIYITKQKAFYLKAIVDINLKFVTSIKRSV